MKTGTKITVTLVGLIALTLSLFLVGQRNNISAIFQALHHNEQDITDQIDVIRKELNDSLKEYSEEVPRDFTPEEENKIISGELEPEEALELLFPSVEPSEVPVEDPVEDPEKAPDSPPKSTARPAKASPEPTGEPEKDTLSKTVSDSIAKLYLYKASYLAKLGRLEQSAIDEFLELPEEKRTTSAKQKILLSKVSEAAKLEKTCDTQVEEILRTLEEALAAEKGDQSIVSRIQAAYKEEKSLRKAYYINRISK